MKDKIKTTSYRMTFFKEARSEGDSLYKSYGSPGAGSLGDQVQPMVMSQFIPTSERPTQFRFAANPNTYCSRVPTFHQRRRT